MSKLAIPVEKNETYEVQFEDLTHEGSAVAKIEGFPIFVPLGLVGEKARIKVVKVLKNYGFGRIEEIVEESPHRVEPACEIYSACGGCQLQHMSYEGQLEIKQKQVRDVLARIGGIKDIPVHKTLGMEDSWKYRNKSQVPVGEKEGKIVAGFYTQRTHDIIDMNTCLIQEQANDELVQGVKKIAEKLFIVPYNEKTNKGVLRHIVVRYAKATGEVMLVVVTKTNKFPQRESFIAQVLKAFPSITSIVQNVNPAKTNVILGETSFAIYGKDTIEDRIGDIRFEISARSFYQVNPLQTKVLYDKALEYANLTGEETVIDAYCGIGTISLFLAQKAKRVYGVEIVEQAVEDAKKNAELNGITNTLFEAGPAEVIIPQWAKVGIKADVLVVDPPRKGCDEKLLQTIAEMKPAKVVYVSCSPATLARDLKFLEENGYKTVEVQPVDMFPHSTHVECVAQLVLK